MAWVPLVAANRRSRYYRRRSGGGIIAVVILFILMGIFFLFFFVPFEGFALVPLWTFIIGFFVFFIVIGTIAAVASSMSSSTQQIKEEHMKHMNSIENQVRALEMNPYRMQNSVQKQQEAPIYSEIKRDIPIISDINYCRYCGEKVERDAKFCHQCGMQL